MAAVNSSATLQAGYSGKPLPEKLGYRAGQRVAFLSLPPELEDLSNAVAFGALLRGDWTVKLPAKKFDLVHAFTASHAELEAGLAALQAALRPNGTIWISWPKKAAKVMTDLTEDRVRDAALKLDLVDVKVAAIDEKWSGLKLVIRKDRR